VSATTDDVRANDTAQAERQELCDLLVRVGPDAPTLCEGWTARDLAAHLWVRENRIDAAAGIGVPALAGWTTRVQDGVARRDWQRLVAQVRTGPPRWSLQRIDRVDELSNTIEYFVHHEDVRRAAADWQPRELPERRVAQLWSSLGRGGRFIARHSPVGVVLRPTDGPGAGADRELRGAPDGHGTVVLVGPVAECVLAVFGRVTRGLQLEGTETDIDAFHAYPR
jgi:uncharacterized protein (TIGR03085 family)